MSPHRRIVLFACVGATAAAVHWAVAVALVQGVGLAPLNANAGGWGVAFFVSFAGQFGLTFRDHGARLVPAALRFLAVSAMGFAINEAAYALLLRVTAARFDLLLALVLVGVAALTYLLSRRWAFR
jgi:putative flippase GtrA